MINKDMQDLGIHLIAAVPEPIADCWVCLTDSVIELPSYISECPIYSKYWLNWGIELKD